MRNYDSLKCRNDHRIIYNSGERIAKKIAKLGYRWQYGTDLCNEWQIFESTVEENSSALEALSLLNRLNNSFPNISIALRITFMPCLLHQHLR